MHDHERSTDAVLLTWLARNNDPFDRGSTEGSPIDGPTLTLLFDPDSPFHSRIRDVVVFYRESEREPGKERAIVDRLRAEIARRSNTITVRREVWRADDPTDHAGILGFLRGPTERFRQRFAGRELIIHASPGTPAMQTVWVLMAECGLIEPPFQVVKSYRRRERRGRPPVVPVELGIETYFKVYREARSSAVDAEHDVWWDRRRFRSARLRELYDRAARVAQLRVPVLILGERGTGKTTLASWIRANSRFRQARLDRNWPTVACGQFTGETMRSELLGHVKGAFTGATADRPGLFARADGDTLFLDEIADLAPSVQRLLIRAIEEQRFTPLGADTTKDSRFRLLTATNRSLDTLRERLDPDFFDRISAFRLTVPPLREIPEDLDWLWASAYRVAGARADLVAAKVALPDAVHEAVVERLRRHPLPGNVRDLLRVAWHVQAHMLDEKLGPTDAVQVVEHALEELHGAPRAPNGRTVAQLWADDAPLDAAAPMGQPFPAKAMIEAFRRWLATSLLDLGRRRGLNADAVSDVTGKTLRQWRRED